MIDFDDFSLKLEADSEDEFQPTIIKEESLVYNSLDEYTENDGQPFAFSTLHVAPNSSWFQCSDCKMLTLCKTTFDRHVQICGQNPKQSLCSNCTGELEQQYQNRKLWECNVCPFKTYHLALFVLHRKNHKIKLRRMKRYKKTVYFQCENCEFQTKVRDRLLEHKKLHSAQLIKESQVNALPATVTKTMSDEPANDLMLLNECQIINQQVRRCTTCAEANQVVQKEEEPTINAKVDCHRCEQCNHGAGLSESLKHPNNRKTFISKQSIPTNGERTSDSILPSVTPEQNPNGTRRSAFKCAVDTAEKKSQMEQGLSTPMLLYRRTRRNTQLIPQIKMSLEEGETGSLEPITYVCRRCGYRGRNFHRYIIHQEDMHGFDCSAETNKCHKCKWNFPTNDKLLEHNLLHKLKISSYRCAQCSYRTKKKSFFIKHFINKHET